MLEFILGTSGSGKTGALYNRISREIESGKKVMLLVPEQYSFESERALFDRLGELKMRGVEVLSFKRLANNVFREYGGLSASYIDDTGKLLTMSAAVSQLGDSLEFYAKKANAHSVAFISELVAAANELKNACVTPEDMRAAAGMIAPERRSLADKTRELADILETYQALLERSGSDPADILSRACRRLEGKGFFSGTSVFIDSFNDFTAAELRMLEHIISGADNVCFALETDGLYDGEDGCGLFSIVKSTAARLIRIARSRSVDVAQPVVCSSGKRFASPELAHLEANLFRAKQRVFEGGAEGVSIVSAHDGYEEFEYIASEIRRLTCSGDVRYRDIAVITRSASAYGDAMISAFERYGVPYFYDRRSPVASKPLMTLIICAARAAAAGYSSETLLRLAKTGLAGLNVEEISRLEDYVYIWKISGSRWEKPFTEDPFGFEGAREDSAARLEELERLRLTLITPLEKLRGKLADCDGTSFARGIYEYLVALGMPGRLETLAQDYDGIGEPELADELEPLWELALSLLEQFSATLDGIKLPARRFAELFRLAAASADIASIPRTVDQVVVGSADRIRTGDVKVVFVAGINDGEFPAAFDNGGLFTSDDRAALARCGLDIAGTNERQPLFEWLYLYNAATGASERVYFSFKRFDVNGAQLRPSAVVGQIRRMFPQTKPRSAATGFEPDGVWNDATAFALYAAGRRAPENAEFSAALRNYLESVPEYGGRVQRLDGHFRPERFRLDDKDAAAELMGNKLRLAPSNMERYFGCRFKYFCYDCLKLRKKRPAEMSPLETGTLIHYVLEKTLSRHEARTLSLLGREELRRETDTLLDEYLNERLGGSVEKTERFIYLYERLRDGLVRLLERLGDEFANCDFEPAAFELPIRENSYPVSSVKLTTPEGVEVVVEGFVDRVDVMEKDGRRYVRVVDYKSGGKLFRLSDIYYGLNLQMLIYLFSISRNGTGRFADALPAGVLYLPADGSVIAAKRGDSDETIGAERRKHYRMNGLILNDIDSITGMDRSCSGAFIPAGFGKSGNLLRADVSASLASLEELGRISEYIDALTVRMAQTLLGGDVAATPIDTGLHSACDLCDYGEICRRTSASEVRSAVSFRTKQDFYDALADGLKGGEKDDKMD